MSGFRFFSFDTRLMLITSRDIFLISSIQDKLEKRIGNIYKRFGNTEFLCTCVHTLINQLPVNYRMCAWHNWFAFVDLHKTKIKGKAHSWNDKWITKKDFLIGKSKCYFDSLSQYKWKESDMRMEREFIFHSGDCTHHTGKLIFYIKQSVLVTDNQKMPMCHPQSHVGKIGIAIVNLRMAHGTLKTWDTQSSTYQSPSNNK